VSSNGKLKRTQSELAKLFKEHGGTFTKGMSKKVNYLVTTEEVVKEATAITLKLAIEFKTPIVAESFLDASLEAGELVSVEDHLLYKYPQDTTTTVMPTKTTKPQTENGKIATTTTTATKSTESQAGPLEQSEGELLYSIRSLFSINTPPMYYDTVFVVEDKQIFCVAGILAVRSKHFAQLLKSARDEEHSAKKITIKIQNVPAAPFVAVVQYLMLAIMTIDSVNTAIKVIEYATSIDCEKAASAAKTYLEITTNTYVQQNDLYNAFTLYNILKPITTVDVSKLLELLHQVIKKNALTLFQDSSFVTKLSRSMMTDLLQDDALAIDEVELFDRLLEWGVVNLLAERKEPYEVLPSTLVHCLGENNHITITKCEKVTDKKNYVLSTDLRKYLADLLPYIRYEHIPANEIFKKLDSKKLFTSDELLQFFKAAMNAKNGEKYTILGVEHEKQRKKRTPKVSDHFDFYVSQQDLETRTRVQLPNFAFCGSIWYVVVMKTIHQGAPHLSFYLYNKIITDGGVLAEPIKTSIIFRLLNRMNPDKNKRQKFTKIWKDVKAWGYSNVLKITELFDPANGWLESNGTFRLQVEISLQDSNFHAGNAITN
jgi:hypothetical protein